MSKVVKGVGRAVGKVVKGVVNGVKKFAKSKLGKIIIAAAAIYFGVPAVMGAFGAGGAAAAGGLSGMAGATANISAAWSSLGTAGTALVGGNLSGAGSALASGFSGTAATGSSALAGAGAGAASPWATSPTGLNVLASEAAGAGAGAGAGAAASPYAPIAAAMEKGMYVQAGMTGAQMAVGANAASKAEQEQKNAQARYGANVGTSLWGDSPAAAGGAPSAPGAYDPALEARRLSERYAVSGAPQTVGLVGRGMQYQQPAANNGFPVYNPMYYRG